MQKLIQNYIKEYWISNIVLIEHPVYFMHKSYINILWLMRKLQLKKKEKRMK